MISNKKLTRITYLFLGIMLMVAHSAQQNFYLALWYVWNLKKSVDVIVFNPQELWFDLMFSKFGFLIFTYLFKTTFEVSTYLVKAYLQLTNI